MRYLKYTTNTKNRSKSLMYLFSSRRWKVTLKRAVRGETSSNNLNGKPKYKERGGGQNISTSFWMWFSQAPLCRYRFKFIFEDIIFLLSGKISIIEYICFWRFNSIIMTWNKWLVFDEISYYMGLNNISPWPCPLRLCLFTVRNYMTLLNTLALHSDPLV